MGRRHARLTTCASTCPPPGLRPDCRISRPRVQTPDGESVFAGPILARPRRRARSHPRSRGGKSSRRTHAAGVVTNRTPLLRFVVPFNAHWPRRAVRGCRAFGRSRFDVFPLADDPRVHGPHQQSVALAVLRSSDARRSCSMCEPITSCGIANRRAFLFRRPEQSARKAAGQRSFTQASPANPNPSRSQTTRHVKQHRFANPLP